MKFCSQCGSSLSREIPAGDNRLRFVCLDCRFIHYENPKIVAGCIPVWEGKILLCRRAIEPRYGLWTIPAGFMENDETVQEAAERETWEEAEALVEAMEIYHLYNIIHVNQLYVIYRGRLRDGKFGIGEESLESHLFAPTAIPWDELAFEVIRQSLQRFIEELDRNHFRVFVGDIYKKSPARKT